MMGRRRGVVTSVWIWAAAAAASGGCGQILGVDWSSYAHGEGTSGMGGAGGSTLTGGIGGDGGVRDFQSGGGAVGGVGMAGSAGTGGGGGDLECSANEVRCLENMPQHGRGHVGVDVGPVRGLQG